MLRTPAQPVLQAIVKLVLPLLVVYVIMIIT